MRLDSNLIQKTISGISFYDKMFRAKILHDIDIFTSNWKNNKPICVLISDSMEGWKKPILDSFLKSKYIIHFDKLNEKNILEYDLVIGLRIDDLKFLNEYLPIEKRRLPFPSTQILNLCNNKYLFNNTLISLGYEEYIPSLNIDSTYPYILKKKIDEWGVNSHIIYSDEESKTFQSEIMSGDYFTQEYIVGKIEYTTHFLFLNRKIASCLTFKKTFDKTHYIQGKYQSSMESKLVLGLFNSLFEKILRDINFEGIGCFNYKIKDGKPQIIELNPRIGSSLNKNIGHFLNALL